VAPLPELAGQQLVHCLGPTLAHGLGHVRRLREDGGSGRNGRGGKKEFEGMGGGGGEEEEGEEGVRR